MFEGHCFLLKGLLSMNVMFPSPLHSTTHSPLIAVVFCFHRKNGKDVVTVAWDLSGWIKASVGM